MSSKRQAATELNHDNWDRDEEPEKRGTFQTADSDELKNRVIKKARRKLPPADDGNGETAAKSVFSGFAGFGKATTTAASSATASSPFSFLAKIPAVASSAVSTSGGAGPSTTTFSFGGASTVGSAAEGADPKKTTLAAVGKEGGKSSGYYAKLKGLNQAVSEWIKTHVDKNPLCLLTPIFKDYENYLKDIENDDAGVTTEKPPPGAAPGASTSASLSTFKFSTTPVATVSFGSNSTVSSSSAAAITTLPAKSNTTSIFSNISKPAEPAKTNGFSFGLKTSEEKPTTSGFSFGASTAVSASTSEDKKPSTTGFSFTSGATPFSFGNIQPPAEAPSTSAAAAAEGEEEEDKPPKVEFKKVVEEDAVYSKKCKVFVKKDNSYADRGVGTLYLKPIKESGKTQLLVRADTNLGNILVNLILSEGIPAQRLGKNNVMLVCLPTPDVEKPTSMLLRVKTGEDADELLAEIEKHKQ